MSLPSAFEEGTPVAMPRRETLRKRGAEPEGQATGGRPRVVISPRRREHARRKTSRVRPRRPNPKPRARRKPNCRAKFVGPVPCSKPLFLARQICEKIGSKKNA